MSARKMDLFGFDADERASNALSWFVASVVRRAFELEPAARSALFAVGRIAREGGVRTEYAFVLCEEPSPGWPVASSPKLNAMFGDGRSKALIARAIRELYGCDDVDLGHEPGQPFWDAFARFTREPARPDAPFASAYAPVTLFTRRERKPDDWEARISPFAVVPHTLATILSPECVSPAVAPASDDPRDLHPPPQLLEIIRRGTELQYSVQRAQRLDALVQGYLRAPTEEGRAALKQALGVRDEPPTNSSAESDDAADEG